MAMPGVGAQLVGECAARLGGVMPTREMGEPTHK
jgi:hypothetical protein